VAHDDSVRFFVHLPPASAGTHVYRLVADTLAKVVETNEFNNSAMKSVTVVTNQTPVAGITLPADSSMYVTGVPIPLIGTVKDDRSPASQLTRFWYVDLRRPGKPDSMVFASPDSITSFTPPAFNGSGVYLRVRWRVTEPTGLSDTAAVSQFREVDLEPLTLQWSPATPTSSDSIQYSVFLRNNGRMVIPAPWWLRFTRFAWCSIRSGRSRS
jgi:hypothetical protein